MGSAAAGVSEPTIDRYGPAAVSRRGLLPGFLSALLRKLRVL